MVGLQTPWAMEGRARMATVAFSHRPLKDRRSFLEQGKSAEPCADGESNAGIRNVSCATSSGVSIDVRLRLTVPRLLLRCL